MTLRTGTVLVPHEAVWWDGSDEGWAAVVDALPWDQCSVSATAPGSVGVYGHEQRVQPGWLLADPVIRRADADDCEKVIADE